MRSFCFALDDHGVAARARQIHSPNQDLRPPSAEVSLVVLHGISLPPGTFGGPDVVALFTNRLDTAPKGPYAGLRGLEVSAHFLVRRDGATLQFVPTLARAWHAGESSWRGRCRCNDFSVGVELEGTDVLPYTEAQYQSLDALLAGLGDRHPITAVVGHSTIAPGRKTDPGPAFDWGRVERAGFPCPKTVVSR